MFLRPLTKAQHTIKPLLLRTMASQSAQAQKEVGDSASGSAQELGVENFYAIKAAAGVNLSEKQKVVVGSVLDVGFGSGLCWEMYGREREG